MTNEDLFSIRRRHKTGCTVIDIRLPDYKSNNRSIQRLYKTFIDVQYYLLISPYRLKSNNNLTEYRTVKNSAQKILTFMLYILDAIWLLRHLRSAYPKKTESPYQIIGFVYQIFRVARVFYLVRIFWFGQHHFRKLLDYIATSEFDMVRTRPGKLYFSKGFQFGLICFEVLTCVFLIVTGQLPENYNYSQLSFDDWSTALLNKSRSAYFISRPLNASESWDTGDYFICTAGFISYFRLLLTGYGLQYLFLLAAMTIWAAVSSFSVFLSNSNLHSWKLVKHNYDVIFGLSSHLNNCISTLALWYLVMSSFSYSTSLASLLIEKIEDGLKWTFLVLRVYRFTFYMFIFLICGHACSKVVVF